MAPQTRSHGVPAPSRVYHSTPVLQQARFPARKKTVRTYGKQARKKDLKDLRQQTLTQFDFVSSFEGEDEPIVLSSDSEQGENDDKENRQVEDQDGDQDDEDPVPSGRKRRAASKNLSGKAAKSKRRRTLGDATESKATKTKEDRQTRRRTLGDAPSSSYHTQTLTQFLGRPQHTIQDSEDEDEEGGDNGGFDEWLGLGPASPSPRPRSRASVSPTKQSNTSPSKVHGNTSIRPDSRQESMVPQTPATKHIRFEIPSSSQQSSPVSAMMDRYGAPDKVVSPLKDRTPNAVPLLELTGRPKTTTPIRRKVVIEDSYSTESWCSGEAEPTPDKFTHTPEARTSPLKASSSFPDVAVTPTRPKRRGESTELGERRQAYRETTESPSPKKKHSPKKRTSPKKVFGGLQEIPDSDEDEDDEDFLEDHDDGTYVVGAETQFVLTELATPTPAPPVTAANDPDSSTTNTSSHLADSSSAAEQNSTQLANTASSSTASPTKALPTLPQMKPLRYPLHTPTIQATQTQPLESQRVPLATLQAFPPHAARTDILLPISSTTLDPILTGYQIDLVLPHKVPAQVVRFWLLDGSLLHYMACAEPGHLVDGTWRYRLRQVYELNNPVDEDDMREEGWIEGDIGRYAYLPPAIVGQLLWNLRHALFVEGAGEHGSTGDRQPKPTSSAAPRSQHKDNSTPTPSISVSQQVEAQLQSDIAHSTQFPASDDDILVPSTPESEEALASPPTINPPPARAPLLSALDNHPLSSYRAARGPPPPTPNAGERPAVRPSQATTASQASTPEEPRLPPALQSSSSLTFQDYGDSPVRLPHGVVLASSQLLTKSQMLPDSLVRDDVCVPPEIWDSDDDGDVRLPSEI